MTIKSNMYGFQRGLKDTTQSKVGGKQMNQRYVYFLNDIKNIPSFGTTVFQFR